MKLLVSVLVVSALFAVVTPWAMAQGDEEPSTEFCGQDVCGGGSSDGTVVVVGSPVDEDCEGLYDTCRPGYCADFPDSEFCQNQQTALAETPLPACVVGPDGTYTNEPCIAPTAPCVAFANTELPEDDPCFVEPTPPVIPPPPINVAAPAALAKVEWPTVDPAPNYTGGLDRYAAGYQYSLHLAGYEAWEPLTATATITQTVVQAGIVYSQDFTASVTATPREVRWDLGAINDDGADRPPSRHSPPTQVVCDGPGIAGYVGDGRFQDWQEYDGYGGNGVCEYVFWGTTVEMGELAEFAAEVVWDVELLTEWDGVVTNVGEHTESFVSGGHEVDVFWSVTLLTDYEEGGY